MTGPVADAKRTAPTGERFEPTFMHGRIIEAEHLARYSWAAQFAANRRVLDAGCGRAYGTAMLAAAGASEVVGVDLDADVIGQVQATARPGTKFEVADLRNLPYGDDEFDLIACFEAIEHVSDPEVVLDELRRVLRPDGLLALSTPNRDVYAPGNPFHLRELTPNELEEELTQRFNSVRLRRQGTWVASGIFDDETYSSEGNERLPDVNVRKVSSNELGKETYTLALASNGELPTDVAVVDLSGDIDLREWSERLDAADHAIEVVPGDIDLRHEAALKLIEGELGELREQLMRRELELAHHTGISAKLKLAEECLSDYRAMADKAEMVVNSSSWRLTRPLRNLGDRLRKYRS